MVNLKYHTCKRNLCKYKLSQEEKIAQVLEILIYKHENINNNKYKTKGGIYALEKK